MASLVDQPGLVQLLGEEPLELLPEDEPLAPPELLPDVEPPLLLEPVPDEEPLDAWPPDDELLELVEPAPADDEPLELFGPVPADDEPLALVEPLPDVDPPEPVVLPPEVDRLTVPEGSLPPLESLHAVSAHTTARPKRVEMIKRDVMEPRYAARVGAHAKPSRHRCRLTKA